MQFPNNFRAFLVGFLFLGAACAVQTGGPGPDEDAGDNDAGTQPGNDAGTTKDSGGGTNDSGPQACSPETCAGCCFNGVCQTGNTVSACGMGGGECAQCVTNQICLTEQTCGVDPESTWLVQPSTATVSTKNGTSDWDFGAGAPDPFIQLWCPSTATSVTSTTPTVNDTFTPSWKTGGCTMKAKDLMKSGYAIEVWDADLNANDVIAAKGTIVPTETDLLAGSMSLSNNSTLVALKVLLTKQ